MSRFVGVSIFLIGAVVAQVNDGVFRFLIIFILGGIFIILCDILEELFTNQSTAIKGAK